MESKDTKMMVGISLRRGLCLVDDDFPQAEKVDINGKKGYFSKWGDSGKVVKYGETITGLLKKKDIFCFKRIRISNKLTRKQVLKITGT